MVAAGARVAIRADGSADTGLGHVTRCLSLAEVLVASGAEVELLSKPLPEEVVSWASRIGVTVRPASANTGGREDALRLARSRPDVALVDGYAFGPGFFATLVEQDCRHVVVDDAGDTAAVAPVMVINQNPSACAAMYRRLGGHPRLLLGLDYVMLRDEIRRARRSRSAGSAVVVVSLGGSDPLELTEPIVQDLTDAGASIRVAIGAANPRRRSLAELLDGAAVDLIDPGDFEDALASADLAVIGAGSTMWETAYLGIPAVAVVVAPNQVGPGEAAERLGFVRCVEGRSPGAPTMVASVVEELLSDDGARSEMSSLGRESVDGAGVDRVEAAIGALLEGLS